MNGLTFLKIDYDEDQGNRNVWNFFFWPIELKKKVILTELWKLSHNYSIKYEIRFPGSGNLKNQKFDENFDL